MINYKCFVYCAEKDKWLRGQKSRFNIGFDDCIQKLILGKFEVVNSPSWRYRNQKSFVVFLANYYFLVPFEIKGDVIGLITIFPDRRYKNGRR